MSAIYQDPFSVYNLVLDLALHHNRAQTGLVAKLICHNLYDLSVFRMNSSQKETFVMQFILYVLMDKPSIQLVEDMTKLIEQIVNCPMAEGVEPVLTLEEMFFHFVPKSDFMREDIVWLKLNLMKNLIELSGDQSWNAIQTEPVPILGLYCH